MVFLKNTSSKRIVFTVEAKDHFFEPLEIRPFQPAFAERLLRASQTCAVGGSPLKPVPEDQVPAEIKENPGKSPELAVLKNITDGVAELLYNGISKLVPAGETVILPRGVAEYHLSRQVRDNVKAFELVENVAPAVEEPPKGEGAQEPAASQETPKPEEPAKVKNADKKSKWR